MENMGKELKSLRRSMVITRIFCVIPAVLFAAVLIGGVYIWGQVSGIVEKAMPAVETMGDVNWTEVVGTLEEVKTAVTDVDWQALSEKVEQFDVEAMNKTLSGLDIEALNEAVENLNKASDAIGKVTSIFK